MGKRVSKQLLALTAVSSVGASVLQPLLAQSLPPSTSPTARSAVSAAPASKSSGTVQLKVRRLPDAVELVIEGTGAAPQLVQAASSSGWQGQLTTATPNGLRQGPQRLSLPELGLQQVSLIGSGTNYQIDVTPAAGLPLSRPVVSADGQSMILTFSAPPQAALQTVRPNLSQPGAVPQPSFAPPLQPRAVAPPVGDMAVGTMVLRNTSFVNVRGPQVTMTLRNAPAKDALMALAQMGGYGFVYVDEQSALAAAAASSPAASAAAGSSGSAVGAVSTPQPQRPVSIAFVNENYSRAVNAVLLASGLTAKLEGNLMIVGLNVGSKGFGARLSKVYRLNQVSPEAAADYLANLGATVTKTNTITTAVTQGTTQNSSVVGAPTASTTQSASQTTVESYGATRGPLLGLGATTDNRLGTITLVGDASVVGVAEQYLRQLDLRQRQVALSVKILDVNLNNDSSMTNSFAVRWGNTFIVNDNGTLLGAFGNNLPPTVFGQAPAANPGLAYPNNAFNDFLRSTILSESAKVVASPTLILQENQSILRDSSGSSGSASSSGGLDDYSIDAPIGRSKANEGVVRVGVNVPTQVSSSTASGGGPTTCTISQLSTSGLVLGARVQKIDDNGFVTFTLSPSISAVERELPSGAGCPPISILRVRRLDTGVLRVREGQTLILTGVISDFDRQVVSKWPIVGDIPFIGQFFRGSATERDRRELVIMVTPKIINDDQGGVYGYGYQPSSAQSREFMGQATN